MTAPSDLATVAMHIRLAAEAAGVTDVRLMSVGRPCNLEPLADRLGTLLAGVGDDGNVLRILPMHLDTYSRQTGSLSTGLIVVTPSRLGRSDVEEVSNLLSISGWRFLGVLPYTSPGIVNRIVGTTRRSTHTGTPAAPDRRDDAVKPNGHAPSRVAELAWRLEHPRHKQKG